MPIDPKLLQTMNAFQGVGGQPAAGGGEPGGAMPGAGGQGYTGVIDVKGHKLQVQNGMIDVRGQKVMIGPDGMAKMQDGRVVGKLTLTPAGGGGGQPQGGGGMPPGGGGMPGAM